MTSTKPYNVLNRRTEVASSLSRTGLLPLAFNYAYNAANQRTRDTLADGSYWVYGYDALGQVTNGCKIFIDSTPVAGQAFDYSFDTIGNRTQTRTGGDQNGRNQRVAHYSANNLNQLTNRDVPAYVDVMGASLLTNTVTVNGQTAYRNQEYFRQQLPADNASSALWTNLIVSGGLNVTGKVYVAQQPEIFRYDADGNLTNDGRWAYTRDAENRLIGMSVTTGVGPQYQLSFAYDAKGRRIQKSVSNNGTNLTTINFLYDGWNLVAELGTNNALLRNYTWGNDLSGSQQGAGGVGGLLAVSYHGTATTNAFAAYDGNGNVEALINAADGVTLANYEYGSFGEVIRSTGPMAKANPFRFSTKYQDDESDLLYYGYRYYKPSTGTWLSRDPLGESGCINLYVFCYDHPTYGVDPYGMDLLDDAANFAAGVGDSLTFGLTRVGRRGIDWMLLDEGNDLGVDPTSGAYIGGEVTEVTVEIAVTAGGAALRHTARLAVRQTLEGSARATFRRSNKLVGGIVHHANPIKGHPGGAIARYPLPFKWAAQGAWNMKWVPSRAAHMAEHQRMLTLEALDEVREATILVRQGGNAIAAYLDGNFCDWSVNVSANVSGNSAEAGPIPTAPMVGINADASYSESVEYGAEDGE